MEGERRDSPVSIANAGDNLIAPRIRFAYSLGNVGCYSYLVWDYLCLLVTDAPHL